MTLTLKNILGYDELDDDLKNKLQFIEGEASKDMHGGMK